VCDTLCVVGTHGTLFAKNSDRPPSEVQLPEAHARRSGSGVLRTQYLQVESSPTAAVLLSRPLWLWGAEHGVNEHGVAIGNERVDTRSGAAGAPPALIGMDVVRLGLERARTADEALEVMTSLLERYGQGGVCDQVFGQAYDSSFLIADGSSAWVLETAGRTWAAEPVGPGHSRAISNRLTIGTRWTRASPEVAPGESVDSWADPAVDTAYADIRLAASRSFLAGSGLGPHGGAGAEPGSGPTGPSAAAWHGDGEPPALTPARVVAHLRDHGTGPWRRAGAPPPPPTEARADGTGITLCMHLRGLMATTASLVAQLPAAGAGPLRSWVAVGSPCVSVYVPLFGIPTGPGELPGAEIWHAAADLRDRVEAHGEDLAAVRQVLDPLEADLWAEADDLVQHPGRWRQFHRHAWPRVARAMAMAAAQAG